jgi:septation ring formation regulator EzrA
MVNRNFSGDRMTMVESDIKYIKEGIDDIKESLKNHIKDNQDSFEKLDSKYANIRTEYIVNAGVTLVLMSVVGAVLYLVIR